MVQIIQELAPVGRKMRSPKHPFVLRTQPYAIQPFFIAPVLPGETMKNILLQSRVVTDPVKMPLVGWWKEYYFFYVKHRDLDARDTLTQMMLNPSLNVASLRSSGAVPATFTTSGAIDWVQMCLKRVTEEYFRDEGEAWNAGGLIDGCPMAHAMNHQESVFDSFTMDDAMPEYDPNDVSAQDYEAQYAAWEYLRAQKLTAMSYEDYLATFGVGRVAEPNKPELVRYVKDWQYPSNTVNPADGSVASAVSWSIAERADKDRFFKEPGFLFGVTVARPKIYINSQNASASGFLDNAFAWLPALMKDNPETSLKRFVQGEGPLRQIGDADGYWLDMRDLFLYGEQFFNHDITAAGDVPVYDPFRALRNDYRYIQTTEIAAFWKTATAKYIREDGVVSLKVLGAQIDNT